MELIWTCKTKIPDWNFNNYLLAYKTAFSIDEHHYVLYIDASNGSIFKMYDDATGDCATTGNVGTMYDGSHYMSLNAPGPAPLTYYLSNSCNPAPYYVFDKKQDTTGLVGPAIIGSDNANSWTTDIQKVGGQVYYGINLIDSWYRAVHSRQGYDNANAEINAYVNTAFVGIRNDGSHYMYGDNAFSTYDSKLTFGYGYVKNDGYDDLINTNIVGHEYSHKVTWKSAALTYFSQSGALNEAFSDCMAELSEGYFKGALPDWKIEYSPGQLLRSMSDPNSGGQPKYYKGINWRATDTCNQNIWNNDACFVHTNSGVMNHWVYLLCSGTGNNYTSEGGNKIAVNAISVDNVSRICYRALTVYLTNTSDYLDCRNATVKAAEDLYGVCSNQAVQCAKAWFAVGADVESVYYDRQSACINLTSTTTALSRSGIRSFTLAPGVCSSVTQTAANYPINFNAGQFVNVKSGVLLTTSGTQPIILAPTECAYSTD